MNMRLRLAAVLALLLAMPAVAMGGALERIREKNAITWGYIGGSAPFSFVGDDR